MDATIVGTEGDDVITGTEAADVIVGLGGNDTIDGAGEFDRICGDAGDDEITDQDGYVLSGGDGHDTLTADSDASSQGALFQLIGGEGNDTMRSPVTAAFVRFIPGPGDDIVEAEGANDILDLSSADAAVRVDLAQGRATGQGTDQLAGIERVDGSRFDDTLIGSEELDVLAGGGGADVVRGAEGNDRFTIGKGDDTVEGGAGSDWVLLEGIADYTGVTNLSRGFSSSGRGSRSDLSSIENVVGGQRQIGTHGPNRLYGGSGGDFIDGKRGADVIKPGGKWDEVWAGRGDDFVAGCGGGNDRIDLGPGNDVLDPVGSRDCSMYPGRDVIDGGPGRDLVTYALLWVGGYGGVDADLERGTCIRCDGERRTPLIAIEDIRGSNGNDRLAGNDLANKLYGLDGNDTLDGRGGRDRVSGGPGRDNCVEGEFRTGCE